MVILLLCISFCKGWHEVWQRKGEGLSIHLSNSPTIFTALHLHLSSFHLSQLHLTYFQLLLFLHITLQTSVPFSPSSVCLCIFLSLPFSSPYLSTSPSSLSLSPALPSISCSPCCFSVTFYFPSVYVYAPSPRT